jgi:MoaA/NifB/PqqE/SkfB family radical SAM enzyme
VSIPLRNIARMATTSVAARTLGTRKPLNVMLAVTDRCTGSCVYCVIPQRAQGEMSLVELRKLIDEIAEMGCQRLGIWGGEPLCRDDLGEIVRHAKRRDLFVTIDTNGHLVAERYEMLREVDHLNVSLDGGREAHDATRGAGNFDRTMRGMVHLTGRKPYWTITVLSKRNLDQVDWILDLARRMGFLTSYQILHHNDEIGRNDGLRPGDADTREVIRLLMARKQEGAPVASSVRYLQHMLDWPDYSRNRLPDYKGYPACFAGQLYCNVDVSGQLYPCSLFIDEIEAPNVRDLGFRKAFEQLSTPACRACTAACFTEYNHLYRLDWQTGLNWVRALRR